MFPHDGPLGLVATTLARAGGIWRRVIGISLVLCRKQANLLSSTSCSTSDTAVVQASGCAAGQCHCEASDGSPSSCLDPSECQAGWVNHPISGWAFVKKECAADAAPETANCNLMQDNFVDGFVSNGHTLLARMGVRLADYDLAHYFGKRGGGGLGSCCVCGDEMGMYEGGKAGGGTALDPPNADAFNVDYVAHELGHQFGHGHTFAGTGGNCGDGSGGGNFLANQAVELGAGKTLLSYAGICEDVSEYSTPRSSDPYMASVSLGFYSRGQNDPSFSPVTWRDASGDLTRCGTVTGSGNQRPTGVPQSNAGLGVSYELVCANFEFWVTQSR